MSQCPVNGGSDHGPRRRSAEGHGGGTGNKPRQHEPDVDVAPARDQPKAAKQDTAVVQAGHIAAPLFSADAPSVVDVRQVVGRVRSAHEPCCRPGPGRALAGKVSTQGEIPRALVEVVEHMLELADPRRHVLDPRQLAVDAIQDLHHHRQGSPRQQPAVEEKPGDRKPQHAGRRSHLPGRDRSRRQQANEPILEKRIEVGRRKILAALLHVIEEDTPRSLCGSIAVDAQQMQRNFAAMAAHVRVERRQRHDGNVRPAASAQNPDRLEIHRRQHLGRLRCIGDAGVGRLLGQPVEQPLIDQQVARHDQDRAGAVGGFGNHAPGIRRRRHHVFHRPVNAHESCR